MTSRFKTTLGLIILLTIAVAISTTPAAAQLNSNLGTVTLNATLPEALTVTVNSGAIVNFNLTSNTAANPGSAPTVVTTAWVLKAGRANVNVYAYVADTSKALTGTGGVPPVIPATAVGLTTSISVPGLGPAPTPTSGTMTTAHAGTDPIPGAPAGGLLFANKVINGTDRAASFQASIAWNIDTTVTPQLPADSYTGTVTIQAQATP
jgi:hypothetical protein